MKKLLTILLSIIAMAGYSQSPTKGALNTVDTTWKPTIKMLAINKLDNTVVYWNLSYWTVVETSSGGGIPTWQQTLTAGSTLTGNNKINVAAKKLVFDSVGNGSRFYLAPTTAQSSKFDITLKSSNGSDSSFFYVQKGAFSASTSTVMGIWDNTNGIRGQLSMTMSGGEPFLTLTRNQLANSKDFNLRIDASGINMYAQNSTGTANTLVRAEPDSIVNKAYDASNPSVYSYLNIYRDSIYAKVNGKISMGSNWADQYANDSLLWRTTDRTGAVYIYPNEVKIYGGSKELEVTNSGIEFTLGSDATGDMWYRNSSGFFTRLPIGTAGQHLIGGTIPHWSDTTTNLSGSATLDFGSTSAGASTDLTITVTGAALSDVVSLGVPNASTLANGVFTAWVSSSNTITVRFTNTNLVSALDPASGTFKVKVLQ